MPVDASLTEGFPTWNLTVNDTAPMWAYVSTILVLADRLLTGNSVSRRLPPVIVVPEWSCKCKF